jgi:serine/threonine protein kinase
MKAINIGYAIKMWKGASRTDLINEITEEFRYERDILEFCGENKMDRVVRAIDSGEYDEASDPYFVPYLVFEFSEEGDVRRHKRMTDPDLVWRLRIFHGICVGVRQLHGRHIAHQDLKPSNVLVFDGEISKIADLGRCTMKGTRVDDPEHCGDKDYTPIELHYGHYDPDWNTRRKGADLYMLGGLLAFLVANVHIFGLVLTKLPEKYHPRNWGVGRYREALPAVRAATYDAIEEIVAALPTEIQPRVRDLLSWLCDPEPHLRGHPKTRAASGGNQFALERVVSAADDLARRAGLMQR